MHSVEKREIISHQKNISSNQLFRNLFSKTVTFTKFLPEIGERELPIHTVDFSKFLYHEFLKNFRENNFFSKEFTI